jgi:hypothetical protein
MWRVEDVKRVRDEHVRPEVEEIVHRRDPCW